MSKLINKIVNPCLAGHLKTTPEYEISIICNTINDFIHAPEDSKIWVIVYYENNNDLIVKAEHVIKSNIVITGVESIKRNY